jgi:hypothetical protein
LLAAGALVLYLVVNRGRVYDVFRRTAQPSAKPQRQLQQPTPQLGVVNGELVDEGKKQQVRGIFRGWTDTGVELFVNADKAELITLKPQVQYACLPSTMQMMDGDEIVDLSGAYMNLTASDGLGE